MDINIKGLSDILKMISDLFSGVKNLGKLPAEHRAKLLKDIAATAEIIDETLTVLKGHLSKVIFEIQMGDKATAAQMVAELANNSFWESHYRQFQMCHSLWNAGRELDTLVNKELVNKISLKDAAALTGIINGYIAGEGSAGRLVSETLADLSKLTPEVDTNPQLVVASLEKAKSEIQDWRDKFIDMEKELRRAI
ncbi:MAG: hypothetical protein ABI378_03080 [Chitinophagaceae bacterium]